ncbi:MAG: citrate synthase [Propionibacteriaceae bacterium]|jgi:citrate synthase|nr:citrate synthase [Propionibacteriaceae bacterium]
MGNAVFTHGAVRLELPMVRATAGNNGYDITKLLARTGETTYDIGFGSTAACKSAITFIDGEAGVLRYRGYPIEQLAEKASFMEVAYLVLYGELPNAEQLDYFNCAINGYHLIDERLKEMFRSAPRRSHPMPLLAAAINSLSTFVYTNPLIDPTDLDGATHRLMGAVPTLAAYGYKNSIGQPMLYPLDSESYVENFIRMSFGVPSRPYPFDEEIIKALDVLLILHADHEQNCSTSTVRLVGSSGANVYVSVAAGVNALSGPLHGGANQAVLEMLAHIKRDGGGVNRFVEKVKQREAKLMGFGHRIYKNYDPRAAIVKQHADAILRHRTGHDELLDIALTLEDTALNDPYFQERKLYPNVDFYTGLIYQAMGFPVDMFTVLFAIGRLPGWIAHWREQAADPTMKIGRPRQIYVGQAKRDFVPLDQR